MQKLQANDRIRTIRINLRRKRRKSIVGKDKSAETKARLRA
jgi:hypothetical protein